MKNKQINMKATTRKKHGVFKVLGATSHSETIREENDWYSTPSHAVTKLLELETFPKYIYEPCCAEGSISKVLESLNYKVKSEDLYDRGFGKSGIDFLQISTKRKINYSVITNPPYKLSVPFIRKALEIVTKGNKVAMLLPLTFLESKSRAQFFEETPPSRIYVSRSKLTCAKKGDFEALKGKTGAMAMAWMVWDTNTNFSSDPIIKWFN
jgi:hypothetical protein